MERKEKLQLCITIFVALLVILTGCNLIGVNPNIFFGYWELSFGDGSAPLQYTLAENGQVFTGHLSREALDNSPPKGGSYRLVTATGTMEFYVDDPAVLTQIRDAMIKNAVGKEYLKFSYTDPTDLSIAGYRFKKVANLPAVASPSPGGPANEPDSEPDSKPDNGQVGAKPDSKPDNGQVGAKPSIKPNSEPAPAVATPTALTKIAPGIAYDLFGGSIANAGDLDGGGGTVLAVGINVNSGRGAIKLLSFDSNGREADVTIIPSQTDEPPSGDGSSSQMNGLTLEPNEFFGTSIANAGTFDLDGDSNGLRESTVLVVGARTRGLGGAMYFLPFSAAGVLTSPTKIDENTANGPSISSEDGFGDAVANVGKLTGNNNTVIAVGAMDDDTGGEDKGAIHLLSFNSAGVLTGTTKIAHGTTNGPNLTNNDRFGGSIANMGDADGGGGTVLAVGAQGDDTGISNGGAVYLLSFSSAGVLTRTTRITHGTSNGPVLPSGGLFGISLANIGDVDGGGGTVLAVGAAGDDTAGTDKGAIHLLSFNSAGVLTASSKTAHQLQGGPALSSEGYFGASMATISTHLDGSSGLLLAVGAPYDATGGTYSGVVHLLEYR